MKQDPWVLLMHTNTDHAVRYLCIYCIYPLPHSLWKLKRKNEGPQNIFKCQGITSGKDIMNKNISPVICLSYKILHKRIVLSKLGSGMQKKKILKISFDSLPPVLSYHFTYNESTNDIRYVSVWLQTWGEYLKIRHYNNDYNFFFLKRDTQ